MIFLSFGKQISRVATTNNYAARDLSFPQIFYLLASDEKRLSGDISFLGKRDSTIKYMNILLHEIMLLTYSVKLNRLMPSLTRKSKSKI
jgi:hypothetical protein